MVILDYRTHGVAACGRACICNDDKSPLEPQMIVPAHVLQPVLFGDGRGGLSLRTATSDHSLGVLFEYSDGSLCADGVNTRRILITAECDPTGSAVGSVRFNKQRTRRIARGCRASSRWWSLLIQLRSLGRLWLTAIVSVVRGAVADTRLQPSAGVPRALQL